MVSGTGTRWPSNGCNATAKKLPCAAGGSWSCTPRPSSTARANRVQLASSGSLGLERMVGTLEGEASFPLGGNSIGVAPQGPGPHNARDRPSIGTSIARAWPVIMIFH